MTSFSNTEYKMGSVIWDKLYQKYLIIIGYDKETDKFLVDNHEITKLTKSELDNFRSKKYYKENENLKVASNENKEWVCQ